MALERPHIPIDGDNVEIGYEPVNYVRDDTGTEAVDIERLAAHLKGIDNALTGGGGGITASQHKALRDLIHFIDDGPADGFVSGAVHDTTYSGAFPVTEVWYEDSGRTQKIVQLDVTYSASLPVTEVWRMYDQNGVTVLVTLTDSITYSGIFESSRTRTWV